MRDVDTEHTRGAFVFWAARRRTQGSGRQHLPSAVSRFLFYSCWLLFRRGQGSRGGEMLCLVAAKPVRPLANKPITPIDADLWAGGFGRPWCAWAGACSGVFPQRPVRKIQPHVRVLGKGPRVPAMQHPTPNLGSAFPLCNPITPATPTKHSNTKHSPL